MSKLEHPFYKCSYGYQTVDGKVVPLGATWGFEAWTELIMKSKLARCWLDPKRDEYL